MPNLNDEIKIAVSSMSEDRLLEFAGELMELGRKLNNTIHDHRRIREQLSTSVDPDGVPLKDTTKQDVVRVMRSAFVGDGGLLSNMPDVLKTDIEPERI